MGPPGSKKGEVCENIAGKLGWKIINIGDLLRKEVQLKTADGKSIDESFKKFKPGKKLVHMTQIS